MSNINHRILQVRMSQRAATSDEWLLDDIPLKNGEIGIENDTGAIKIGDNDTNPHLWSDLPYQYNSHNIYVAGTGIDINNYYITANVDYEIID